MMEVAMEPDPWDEEFMDAPLMSADAPIYLSEEEDNDDLYELMQAQEIEDYRPVRI